MNKINICIIDDHKIVSEGLKQLIEKLGNYEIIYSFESGAELLNNLPLQINPDLYILDYSMPNMNGIELLKHLITLNPENKVLVLTQYLNEEIINESYQNGARGFLNKNCTAHDLKYAIENIINIGYNNVAEILKRIRIAETNETLSNRIILTERELQFLTLVCNEAEYTYEQMAVLMNVSVKSIDSYRANLFDKYSIKSKIGLVLFSYNNKLTKPFINL